MLVAYLDNGIRISLLAGYTKEELREMQRNNGFYCPECRSRMQIKAGTMKIWHFSHLPGASECSLLKGESMYHLLGKKLLYEQASRRFPNVQLEPFFPDISQRPDLFIPANSPVEFQCSTISSALFMERTKGYISMGMSPKWILGRKRLKILTPVTFQLSSFDWLTANLSSSQLPSLTYFCPEEANLLYLSSIVPVTSTRVYGNLLQIPLEKYTFHDIPIPIFKKSSKPLFPVTSWLHTKKQWRLHAFKQNHPTFYYLKKLFLQNGSAITYFPSEAGMPVMGSYTLIEPSYVWQSYLLLLCIIPVKIGAPISYSRVYNSIQKLVEKKMLTTRQLPLIKNIDYSHAVLNYLELLCAYGILKQVGEAVFTKIRNPVFPSTMDSALKNDYLIMQFSVKHGLNALFSGKM
ncbi:competence protein CoiA [Fictibacillus fluitans]|uniref:Competence protein CoiA family protein n=1 Tax=Fictibacillus fluitans TaxID=3058422 RepID=A0ABT8HSC9_9BACL|nr:competence protein CoiA family protein [Fictibacillus sp. NE201]MDN4523651.1 competence protein CoiA family protein [Fictibacillus sp. NE201]